MTEPINPKDNPIAAAVAKVSVVARKQFPVIAKGTLALSTICILAAVQWITIELVAVSTLATFTLTAFQAGMVWQRINNRKER